MHRDGKGRFSIESGCYVDPKGYICVTAGPQRGQRLHRLIAAQKLGRALRKDEEVHHRNGEKLDNRPENLEILGNREHGWVSAKQAFWMKMLDIKAGEHYRDYFAEGVLNV